MGNKAQFKYDQLFDDCYGHPPVVAHTWVTGPSGPHTYSWLTSFDAAGTRVHVAVRAVRMAFGTRFWEHLSRVRRLDDGGLCDQATLRNQRIGRVRALMMLRRDTEMLRRFIFLQVSRLMRLPTDREHVRTINLCEGYPAALRRRIDRLWQAEDELEGRLPRPLVGVGTPRRRRLCHTPR